ncbi:MAG: HD domain-containing protein [Bryobacteraceae bacterium]
MSLKSHIQITFVKHEIRDPIHGFIRFDSHEREVINSAPYQRLREIHQLAMTYLVYPGATHKRFEHCLGVMELASRIYDTVTDPANIYRDSVRALFSSLNPHRLYYWRTVLRMAALCHDLGHLPFSHGPEDLLPPGWKHERLTMEIIRSPEMQPCWRLLKIAAEDGVKLALGPKEYYKYNETQLNDWETILAEIIVGDVFGADRMDYLLRNSLHAGVGYGRFDHLRLTDTLRILPRTEKGSQQPTLGIEEGGLQAAESLLWARYLMYTQIYFHHVRRIYDVHLKEFLQAWLPNGKFSVGVKDHLQMTDSEVLTALRSAAKDPAVPGHEPARRICERNHFRHLYQRNAIDQEVSMFSVDKVEQALKSQFDSSKFRRDTHRPQNQQFSFPVFSRGERIQDSVTMSDTFKRPQTFAVDYVFVEPRLRDEAKRWLESNKGAIIRAEEAPME